MTQSLGKMLQRMCLHARTQSAAADPFYREGGVGPVRNKPRGGAAGPRAGKRVPAKPKTAEDLDKELDAYLQDDIPKAQTEKPAAVAVEGDVEMA